MFSCSIRIKSISSLRFKKKSLEFVGLRRVKARLFEDCVSLSQLLTPDHTDQRHTDTASHPPRESLTLQNPQIVIDTVPRRLPSPMYNSGNPSQFSVSSNSKNIWHPQICCLSPNGK